MTLPGLRQQEVSQTFAGADVPRHSVAAFRMKGKFIVNWLAAAGLRLLTSLRRGLSIVWMVSLVLISASLTALHLTFVLASFMCLKLNTRTRTMLGNNFDTYTNQSSFESSPLQSGNLSLSRFVEFSIVKPHAKLHLTWYATFVSQVWQSLRS
jgi:hypothetical protein